MDDLPPQLKFLEELEEPMKCPICYDFMQAPVILPGCDHNYCSLCIRKYFTHKEQCPACGNPACSNQLRSNGIMERTIQQFKKIKSHLISLCLDKVPKSHSHGQSLPPTSECSSQIVPPTRNSPRLRRLSSLPQNRNIKDSPSTSPSCDSSDDSDVEFVYEDKNSSSQSIISSSGSNFRQSVLSPSTSLNQTTNVQVGNIQSKLAAQKTASTVGIMSPSTKENADTKKSLSAKLGSPLLILSPSKTSLTTPKSSAKIGLLSLTASQSKQESKPETSTEKVPCPVCEVPVVTNAMNRHLDLCLGRQEKLSSHKMPEKRKPLPKLVYNLLAEKDIRKRLRQLGLNSKGDRQTMIKRHHEFTMYHNADCDSVAPKQIAELVKEFEETQKLQVKLATRPSASNQSILRFKKDSKQEDIEKAHRDYVTQHKDQFKSLIKEARQRMKAARRTHTVDSSASQTTSEQTLSMDNECSAEGSSVNSNEVVSNEMSEDSTELTAINTEDSPEITAINKTCSVVDDVADETATEDSSESEPSLETSKSTTKKLSMILEDSGDEDVTGEELLHEKVGDETQKPSSEIKTGVVRAATETEAIPDIFSEDTESEEADSDVFEYDTKSKSVQKKSLTTQKGKRTLKSSKPSWQDTEFDEWMPSDKLKASFVDKPKSDIPIISSQENTSYSQTFPSQSEPSKPLPNVQNEKRSHSTNSDNRLLHENQSTPPETESVIDNCFQDALQISDKCHTNSVSEPICETLKQDEELPVPKKRRAKARKTCGKKTKRNKSFNEEINPDNAVTTTIPACEKEDMNNLNDTSFVPCECETKPGLSNTEIEESLSQVDNMDNSLMPGNDKDSLKKKAVCFDLELSDCEDLELPCCEDPRLLSPQHDSDAETKTDICPDLHEKQKSSKKKSTKPNICFLEESNLVPGNTESVETEDLKLQVLESEQETTSTQSSSDSSQVTKPKSLLKKQLNSATLFKKSVRFTGLRSKMNHIPENHSDNPKTSSSESDDKGDSESVSVRGDETVPPCVVARECHDIKDKCGNIDQDVADSLEAGSSETSPIHNLSKAMSPFEDQCTVNKLQLHTHRDNNDSCSTTDQHQSDQPNSKGRKRKSKKISSDPTVPVSEINTDLQNCEDGKETRWSIVKDDCGNVCVSNDVPLEEKLQIEENLVRTASANKKSRRKRKHAVFATETSSDTPEPPSVIDYSLTQSTDRQNSSEECIEQTHETLDSNEAEPAVDNVLQTVSIDSSVHPEDTNQLKCKPKRKRTCKSVNIDLSPSESCVQTDVLEKTQKRRKTSRSTLQK